MTQNSINVTVKLFAIYQEVYQQEEIILSTQEKTPISEILNTIIEEKPVLKKWRNLTRFAVNFDFVDEDYILQDGDEIALIPPVSGG
jgi:molybdopterin synthase sulfur carrier subunit